MSLTMLMELLRSDFGIDQYFFTDVRMPYGILWITKSVIRTYRIQNYIDDLIYPALPHEIHKAYTSLLSFCMTLA